MLKGLGVDQTNVYRSTDIDITKLASEISCSYKCIFINYGSFVVLEFNKEE
jgi:tRNA uridine 5-carbamoylmethylation protein Kti12